MSPALTRLEHQRTHRLIPALYDRGAIDDLFDDEDEAAAVFDLDNATNDRLRAGAGQLAGIGPDELVTGVPYASVINAAFTHPNPNGGRFNTGARGAWYAGFEFESALQEVIGHHTQWLLEIDHMHDTATKSEYLADFAGEFHDLRDTEGYARCLDPDPAVGYAAGQDLAARLLDAGSLGLIYPAMRNAGGTNIACFRPALVQNVQPGRRITLTWSGGKSPEIGA